MTGGENADIAAFIDMPCLTDFKHLIGWRKHRPFRAAEAQVNRSVVSGNGHCGCLGLVVIAGIDHCHTGQHFHKPDIFENLVGGAVFTERQTGMRCANFHIFVGIGDALADLIVHPSGGKIGEGASKGNITSGGESGSSAHHIGFCNTGLKKALGEGVAEGIHHQRTGQVGT